MEKLIKHAQIVTMDDEAHIFRDGCIGIAGNEICYVGGDLQPPAGCEVIDAAGRIAMPGLINAHAHSAMTLFRGAADDLPLHSWLHERIFPMEDRLTGEHVYYGALLAIAEMLRGGTTTCNDMYMFLDDTARAFAETGMRAVLSRGIASLGMTLDEQQQKLALVQDEYLRWNGAAQGRITVCVGPHAEYTCDVDFLQRCAQLAQTLQTRLHIHVSETAKEHVECIERHGRTPVALLESVGALDVPAMLAHCVHITKADRTIMQRHGVSVLHNPGSNLKLASGIAPVAAMLGDGICVALGTDGAASNNNLNMFEEMQLAALLQKTVTEDAGAVSAYQALQMATRNGAQALGLEAGILASGKKADIILVDVDAPHMRPLHDAVNNLVYAAQAGDVWMTMVDGEVLYQNGVFLTLDIQKILCEAECLAKDIVRA